MTPRRRTRSRAALVLAVLAGLLDVPAAPAMAGDAEDAAIVRLDPRLDRLIPAGARLEKIADGFVWVEGPAWDRRRGALLFSDIPANTVFAWREGTGAEVFLRPSGYTGTAPFAGREPGSNGLAFDTAGRLVLCEHGDRRIARLETDGRKTTLADRYDGKRLNSPNDLVFAAEDPLGASQMAPRHLLARHISKVSPGLKSGFRSQYHVGPSRMRRAPSRRSEPRRPSRTFAKKPSRS
jgi:hypothetical protein